MACVPDYQQLSGIELVLESDGVLRKKWRGLSVAQSAFQEAAVEQMQTLGRRPFPPDVQVAVQLDLHHPHTDNQPHIPGVVKAYLDALQGVAYENDRQVSCLTVHRRALDHPMMRLASPSTSRAAIYAAILPITRYTEIYDRAARAMWRDRRYSPWWPRWSPSDEAELRKARRDLQTVRDQPDQAPTDYVRLLEETRLRDGFLADIDRPGPPPRVVSAIHRIIPLPSIHWRLRKRHGAAFLLTLRGEGAGTSEAWTGEVAEALAEFRRTQNGWPFTGFVALDVAVRGQSADGKDLDNLVHGFLVPFEEQLCAARGTVTSYRVYEAVGEPAGVRVRVLDDSRLLTLEIAMARARTPTRSERVLERLQKLTERLDEVAEGHRSARPG